MQIAESNQTALVKQGENPVETGLMLQQAIDFLEEQLNGWPEQGQLQGQLLLALIHLHRTDHREAGYPPLVVAEAMDVVRERIWIVDKLNLPEVSRQVRKIWKQLEVTWARRSEGLQQHATARGLQWLPLLRKIESQGGVGNTSRYAIVLRPIEQEMVESAAALEQAVMPGGVRYFTEDIIDTGRLIQWLTKAIEHEGRGRIVFLMLITPALIYLCLCALLLLATLALPKLGVDGRYFMFLLIVTGVTWATLFPILSLPTIRVTRAPYWIQSPQEDLVLEWRKPPRYLSKSIKVLRYAATCSVCGGRVRIRSGGLRYWGRLVGACDESPREHVFSFDHVTRLGERL